MTNVTGFCGRSCAGTEGVDTIGVYEFDTASNTVVTTRALAEGIGGDPYPSLDGSKYHVLDMFQPRLWPVLTQFCCSQSTLY